MSPYLKYILKRFAMFIIIVLAGFSINFLIPRLTPGDPVRVVLMRMAERGALVGAEDMVKQYRAMFGLDGDLPTQFISYLRETLRGNLGYSVTNFPARVNEMIARAFPWTILLVSLSAITSWLLGSLIGTIFGWIGEESKIGRALAPVALILQTVPYYMLALILVFVFAYTYNIFPISGSYGIELTGKVFDLSLFLNLLWHLALPALSIILSSFGWWFLSMRSMIITVKGEDFITIGEAKGLSRQRIMWKYAFRNALLPQITGLALIIGNMVGGALLTEIVFQYPGMGWLLYTAITDADYPVIQGITLIITLCVSAAAFIVDIVYPLLDPRIKYGGD